ncbi:hypothetical protein VitviT2T_013022 [Vitis vinifera]|uniref:Uncharacterized protein n=1 Tax=Vitis vinifera TaxID=29760 RepID=A0ABY9CFD5_VITVI|nr:hypothetical protein VitviT2T_013022 [Vitis vinifera]
MSTNWSTTETRLHKFRDLRMEQKTGRLNRLPKRDAAMLKRQLSHLQTYLGGIKYMTGLPDIVIIVDHILKFYDVYKSANLKMILEEYLSLIFFFK